ncbi:hypothetical protein CGCF415_v008997 [Colletotrichum fructicola]|uniref:Uncharacterized protein n=1 Tax=Colletotrichum fructicola (strain Nara gc5) TaxID=1213859 RepID=L2G8L8_COLFN|nr:uncharacterized protein CGMCC3_g14130 [Colletotrichum fructicola]KAF4491843.1 hypothetical protein CGGC5_v001837 [Colletotrichum fructicola Nara gc5]KAI8282701.1 hypothetical protein K4K60_003307 [Colletotrichum sp. SAR11_57]KAE9569813.1 hypothetical protein CGMCC3_g14130 [Colletotrichum fructicola]KAF4429510.1 hypothetical protein CFRS1_v014487 [Colletotrichum fructicola]KAF4888354.1 hypothetical protein CGCFRS4_v009971 [Colletotrichum fructicola]
MRTIIDMKTVNEAAPAAPPVTNRTITTSRGLAAASPPPTASRQATDSANPLPSQTSTQTQTASRTSATATGGYYMRDLIQIDVNFKARAPRRMATKQSDNMPKVNQTALELAVMLKGQVQISRDLKMELLDIRVKYEAVERELQQVRQESEQHRQEAKARAEANHAWDKECTERLKGWDAARTAYEVQMIENAAQKW